MFLDILITILGAALVLVGADKLTDGAVGLARRYQIPELVIGLTIVAFGTSLPEFIVSLLASFNHAPSMSIGNIVGSNLFNTLMIVGCSALVCPIVVSKGTVSKDIPLSLLSAIVLPALALDTIISQSGSDNVLSRGDGIVLLGFFVTNNHLGRKAVQLEGGSKFDEVMWHIDQDYVDTPDAQKLQDKAIAAMIDELDPHSVFIP